MSKINDPISENDIQAYLDGRLDPVRRGKIEEYLDNNPSEAKRVRQLQTLNQLLRQRHGDTLNEPLPAQLGLKSTKRRPRTLGIPLHVAASVVWGVVGVLIGWNLHTDSKTNTPIEGTFVRNAAYAHAVYIPEVLHPVEVKADQEQHLVNWLSKRLHANVRAPDLVSFGYSLMGGRLLPNEDQPAAQFMYENSSGNRLTLYVRTNIEHDDQAAFRFAKVDNMSIFYWINGPLGYALTGEIDKQELLNIATAIYKLLDSY